MNVKKIIQILIVFAVVGMLLVAACGRSEPTEEPTPTNTSRPGTSTRTPTLTDTPEESSSEEGAGAILEDMPTRTPVPTATPGIISEAVDNFAETTGLAETTFLELSGTDWINVGISLLIIVAGYFIGVWIITYLLRKLVRRTPTEFDDALLEENKDQLKWLVLVMMLRFGTSRLRIFNEDIRMFLNDMYFIATLIIIFVILWKTISFASDWYLKTVEPDDEEKTKTLVTLFLRGAHIILVIVCAYILLAHYGIDLGGLATALGIGGLALSLAAQDTLADAISGLIILVDQPFRVGDRIEIQGLDTWGDVTEIGTRTTKIRTRDNRLVIVPNSTISKNQVINYTFPDPRYRIQMDIGIAYGTDIDLTRQVLINAVRNVPGILPDKPVDALYNEMADSWMSFRVRWWIESYEDTRHIYDQVNTALQKALNDAGIESPYPISEINIKVDQEGVDMLSHAFGD
ncbi:MAG: mechanosensitive ion channel family protein [Chloroflexota bacterium]|nr:mechanosensitive ion channel family protein [Chloroflexota bacterium]